MIADRRRKLFINWGMILLVVLLSVLRKPQLFQNPRFFAEEGRAFFSFAYNNSFADYLLTPMFGYYALYNVLATSLATLFPLEIAPLITIILALTVQVGVSAYIILSDIPLISTQGNRLVLALSLPLLCPSQIWLTTIGIQYWLCFLTLLILLAKPPEDSRSAIIHMTVLALSGLTGILSLLFTPFYIFKAAYYRNKVQLQYAVTLAICSLVQLVVFATAYFNHDNGLSRRFVTPEFTHGLLFQAVLYLGRILVSGRAYDLSVSKSIEGGIDKLILMFSNNSMLLNYKTIYLLTSVLMLLVTILLINIYRKNIEIMPVILSMIFIHAVSMRLSIGSVGGDRYFFAPSCILLMLLVTSCNNKHIGGIYLNLLRTVTVLIILNHAIDYRPSMGRTYNTNWPRWTEEVRQWRMDVNYRLKIWPPPWDMALKAPRKLL